MGKFAVRARASLAGESAAEQALEVLRDTLDAAAET
jgi:hypothetical protein